MITTINHPPHAVRAFAAQVDWQLFVVGDRKTPTDWRCDNALYLSPTIQVTSKLGLAAHLPWNHYSRKMFGYLYAIRAGAEQIFDTDDDNVPLPDWGVRKFDDEYWTAPDNRGFVNVYRLFSEQHIWPRGFPLSRINDAQSFISETDLIKRVARVGVWQALADGDPDVDAIYRLTDNKSCFFKDRAPVVLGAGTVCPFNSQVTAFRRELFPLLYLPATVSFRFTDILRGLVAQPIMWAHGYALGVMKATVLQERNPHDYLLDFESELPCYLTAQKAFDIAGAVVRSQRSMADNLFAIYEELQRQSIVAPAELELLSAWLTSVA